MKNDIDITPFMDSELFLKREVSFEEYEKMNNGQLFNIKESMFKALNELHKKKRHWEFEIKGNRSAKIDGLNWELNKVNKDIMFCECNLIKISFLIDKLPE